MLAHRQSAALASTLIEQSVNKHAIRPGQLTVHAERGAAMSSKLVALLLAERGITKTHSWPHESNDNPFSEAQIKTLKYWPEYAERFGSIEHARAFCRAFFDWYNEHDHSGLALLTPAMVNFGQSAAVLARRRKILAAAYAQHPERFVRGCPSRPRHPRRSGSTRRDRPAEMESYSKGTSVSVSNLLRTSAAKLSFGAQALMENRSGPLVVIAITDATLPEPKAPAPMLNRRRLAKKGMKTLGADKGYFHKGFVALLGSPGIAAHIATITSRLQAAAHGWVAAKHRISAPAVSEASTNPA